MPKTTTNGVEGISRLLNVSGEVCRGEQENSIAANTNNLAVVVRNLWPEGIKPGCIILVIYQLIGVRTK
jgi:hypothetical protein